MTAKELAEKLDGCQYGEEMTAELEAQAKENGLVVIFGYSDDCAEFRGAIRDLIPCGDGGSMYFNRDGSNFTNSGGNALLSYHKDRYDPEPNIIEAVWYENERILAPCGEYYKCTYKTDIPHETFDVYKDDKPYCRGIVFSVDNLK